MKRLRVILLFLLLGAIVNVAVAWGIALTISPKNSSIPLASGQFFSNDGSWHLMRSEAFGSNAYISLHSKTQFDDDTLALLVNKYRDQGVENIEPRWGSMKVTTALYQSLPVFFTSPVTPEIQIASEGRTFESRGWPMRCLWCQPRNWVSVGMSITRFGPRGFITIPFLPEYSWGPRARGLPLYPIWIGFIVNMLFYAAVLWLLFIGTLALHRMIRCKRGLCVKCAYDLRGTDHRACPECGKESPT